MKKLTGMFPKKEALHEEEKQDSGNQLKRLILSNDQLGQLISLSDTRLSSQSPINDSISPLPASQELMEILRQNGWVESSGKRENQNLNNQAQFALESILSPKISVQLVLGSSEELAITDLFSADGFQREKLVIYTFRESEGIHLIDPGHSPADISDALLAQLISGPRLEGMIFDLDLKEDQLMSYLLVIDLIYSRLLQAKLDAETFPELNFNDEDCWNRFSSNRLGEDLLWCSILIPYLFPHIGQSFTQNRLTATLPALAEDGLITEVSKKVYQPSEFTLALSEGLLPVVNFGSCAIRTDDSQGLHVGFVIGMNVNLAVRIKPEKDENHIQFTGLECGQLSVLLFEIGLPEKEK